MTRSARLSSVDMMLAAVAAVMLAAPADGSGRSAAKQQKEPPADCIWTANVHGHIDFFRSLSPEVRAAVSPASVTVYPGTSHGFIDCQDRAPDLDLAALPTGLLGLGRQPPSILCTTVVPLCSHV